MIFGQKSAYNDGISTLGEGEEDAITLASAVHFFKREINAVDLQAVGIRNERYRCGAFLGDNEAVFKSAVNRDPSTLDASCNIF